MIGSDWRRLRTVARVAQVPSLTILVVCTVLWFCGIGSRDSWILWVSLALSVISVLTAIYADERYRYG